MSWLAPVNREPPQPDLSQARRIHQIVKLRPEHYEAYKKCHAEVWPEVLEQIKRSNIVDYSISYDPGSSLLFASFKYVGKDFEADMQKTREHGPTRQWWSMTDGYQESINPGAVSSEKGGTVGKDGKKISSWWKQCEELFYVP
ncbi:hypothetical protein H2200_007427 [Cladophialophora chaetospira]|uniref:DUF718 domain protein n=1 Tax=Cladophialophora chaetospira TaxID=386627 RepID=A0AA38X7W7_9EURO|nr:hypothetical protein H2200_007427 [Cladophialophora chaetospira]